MTYTWLLMIRSQCFNLCFGDRVDIISVVWRALIYIISGSVTYGERDIHGSTPPGQLNLSECFDSFGDSESSEGIQMFDTSLYYYIAEESCSRTYAVGFQKRRWRFRDGTSDEPLKPEAESSLYHKKLTCFV